MPFHKNIHRLVNLDKITRENIFERNLCWPKIPEYPYKTLKVRGQGSEKTNALFNLVKN